MAESYHDIPQSLLKHSPRSSDNPSTRGERRRTVLVEQDIENALNKLSHLSPGSTRRATIVTLTTALAKHFQCSGRLESLEEAQWISRRSPPPQWFESSDRAILCETLAAALLVHHQNTSKDELESEAVKLRRQALELSIRANERTSILSSRWMKLGELVLSRSGRKQDKYMLNEAIRCLRESVALLPVDQPQMSPRIFLAKALSELYRFTTAAPVLTESIEILRKCMTDAKLDDPNRWLAHRSLATALFLRYDSTGDQRLLDEIITLYRQSIALGSNIYSARDRGSLYLNLSIALRTQYGSTRDARTLAEAIHLNSSAFMTSSASNPEHALICVNMADSLKAQYDSISSDVTPPIEMIASIIDLYRTSLALLPKDHQIRSRCVSHLVCALQLRYYSTGDDSILSDIQDLSVSCLKRTPASEVWRVLCNLAWTHLQMNSSSFNIQRAIRYLDECSRHEVDYAARALMSVIPCLDLFWSLKGQAHECCAKLSPLYHRLVKLLPLLVNPVLDLQEQLRLLRSCRQVGSDAFVTGVRADRTMLAFESLEVAQGVLWSQRLHRRDPQIDKIPNHLAVELTGLLQALSPNALGLPAPSYASPCPLTPLSRDLQHNQSARLHNVLGTIRQVPGLSNFMLGETGVNLCSVARKHPVVVLVGSRDLYYALILSPHKSDPSLIELDWKDNDFARSQLPNDATRQRRGLTLVTDSETTEANLAALSRGMSMVRTTPFSRFLKHIWVKIVQCIMRELDLQPSTGRSRPRLYWCLTGKFSALPVHAAGIYDERRHSQDRCSSYVVSTYVPTLTSLLRVQKTTSPLPRNSLRILLVGEKQAHDPSLSSIPGVVAEVENVAMQAKQHDIAIPRLLCSPTTVKATRNAMLVANVVHLACHGIQDTRDMTQSGFCLGDGRLSISTIMKLRMDDAFLAFLSACETATGDSDQPDQAMHLAAAMLFVGFKAVLASMWAISDNDGPKVAKWFYEELFAAEVIDADLVAYSLEIAVGKLRDSGVSVDRWAPFIHMGA